MLDANGNINVPGEERRRWGDVHLAKGELTIRAETTKTEKGRVLPISPRLRAVLQMIQTGPDGRELPLTAHVFGNEVGERVKDITTAWEICVLRAHGHTPTYRRSGANCLDVASREKRRAIDLHFHDLGHEAGSRLVEAGWPLHHVQEMLGHAEIKQTSTYLNPTAVGLAESVRQFGTKPASQVLAKTPVVELRPSGKAEASSDSEVTVN